MGLSLMKNVNSLYLLAVLVTACGSPEKEAPVSSSAEPATPVPVIIDNTPVTALQVGGTMLALQTDADLGDPENSAWRDAQEYRMELAMAPPVHQSVNLRYDATAAAVPVFLRAAKDGKNLYLRMRWADASENMSTSRTDFADGAAVQFDLRDATAEGTSSTSFMMGATDGPVNIWYWKAGQAQAQNLAAAGFGSTTQLEPAGLQASSVYRKDGEWVVVFRRSLQQDGDYQVQLSPAVNMAFALWQGDEKQRDGLKHVSMGWVSLQAPDTERAL